MKKIIFLILVFTLLSTLFVSAASTKAEWQAGVTYKVGDIVTYNGKSWKCTLEHTSNSAWYPGAAGVYFWQETGGPYPTATPTATPTAQPTGGTQTPQPTLTPIVENVALNKPVTAIGCYDTQYGEENVNDGDEYTVWGSLYNAGPQWFFIDLQKTEDIDHVVLKFYDPYYAPHYYIGVSNDATNWDFAAEITDGTGGNKKIDISRSCRYIGVYLTNGAMKVYGVKEFEAYTSYYPETPTPTSTPTPTATVNPEKKMILTCVVDNLNNDDLYDFQDGFESMGYITELIDTNVSKANLIKYLQMPLDMLYHTGHGNEGLVSTSTSAFRYTDTKLVMKNTIWATCLTLTPTAWKNQFLPETQSVMGYTKNSFDFTDETQVAYFVQELKAGKTMEYAWYISNDKLSSLDDRWCTYVQKNGVITEYSARSGNHPTSVRIEDIELLDSTGIVQVAKSVLADSTRGSYYNIQIEPEAGISASTSYNSLTELASNSRPDAIALVTESYTVPTDAYLNDVISIETRQDNNDPALIVAQTVKYSRTIADYPVKGNGVEDQASYLVSNNKAELINYYWPTANVIDAYSGAVLSVSDAVKAGAESLRVFVKNGSVTIVDAEPAYGTAGPGATELTPAYVLYTADGGQIVISAVNGSVL